MVWTLYFLEKFGDTIVAEPWRQAHRNWRNNERLSGLRIAAGRQAPAQQVVHGAFERVAGAPDLFLDETGDVVVDGESGSHIMMLCMETS